MSVIALIAICCFIFFGKAHCLLILIKMLFIILGYPSCFLGDQPGLIHPYLTIFTSMFMHGGWMHLIGNMVFLWIFGDNIEDSMGHKKVLNFLSLMRGICCSFAIRNKSTIRYTHDWCKRSNSRNL